MTTATTHDQPLPSASLTLATAQARIAELRAAAEDEHLVRAARGPRRTPSWPAGIAAALRDSLSGVLPVPRSAARRQACPTC